MQEMNQTNETIKREAQEWIANLLCAIEDSHDMMNCGAETDEAPVEEMCYQGFPCPICSTFLGAEKFLKRTAPDLMPGLNFYNTEIPALVSFDEYFAEQMKDPAFAAGYEKTFAKLQREVRFRRAKVALQIVILATAIGMILTWVAVNF